MKQTKQREINIEKLLQAQKRFDDLVYKNSETTMRETIQNREIALFVEAGEMINEIGHIWKFWKKNHKVDMKLIKGECSDVLHFILNQGNDLSVDPAHGAVITYADPLEQINRFSRSVMDCGRSHHQWWTCFAMFRGVLDLLGISWDEMVEEYWIKNDINYERQNSGY